MILDTDSGESEHELFILTILWFITDYILTKYIYLFFHTVICISCH